MEKNKTMENYLEYQRMKTVVRKTIKQKKKEDFKNKIRKLITTW